MAALSMPLYAGPSLSLNYQPQSYPHFSLLKPIEMTLTRAHLGTQHLIGNRLYPNKGGISYTFKYVKNTKNSARFIVNISPDLKSFFRTYHDPRHILTTMINQIRDNKYNHRMLKKRYHPYKVDERRVKLNFIKYHTSTIWYKSQSNQQQAFVTHYYTIRGQRIVEIILISRGANQSETEYNYHILIDMLNSLQLKMNHN